MFSEYFKDRALRTWELLKHPPVNFLAPFHSVGFETTPGESERDASSVVKPAPRRHFHRMPRGYGAFHRRQFGG